MRDDLRAALGHLRRHPRPALLTAATLALGVGAATSVFTAVDCVLLRPLPLAEPERLVRVYAASRDTGLEDGPSPPDFQDMGRELRSLSPLAASYRRPATLRGDGAPAEAVSVSSVTPAFFELLGAPLAAGRGFDARREAGAVLDGAGRFVSGDRLAVISYGLWRRRLGGDPEAVGREVSIDRVAWRIVGIAGAGFSLPDEGVDVWSAWDLPGTYARTGRDSRGWRFLDVYGRLAPGAGLSDAREEARLLAADLERRFPDTNRGWGTEVRPLQQDLVAPARSGLLLMMGAVGLVLLIACADAAGLQLAAAGDRGRELALRSAVGAAPARLSRQLLIESLLVGLAGGSAGLGLARLAVATLLRLRPEGLPRLGEVAVDLRIGLVAIFAAAIASLLSGWLPSRRALGRDVAVALRAGGRGPGGAGRVRTRRWLVSAQAALALLLVAGALLFTRSFARLMEVDRGFDTDRVLVMRMRVEKDAGSFYRSLIERLEALPGVRSAGAVTALPMSEVGADFDRPYWQDGEPLLPRTARQADIRMATPGYFRTLGIPLLQGRAFDARDRREAPLVIAVSRGLARREWPGRDPVGRHLVIDYFGGQQSFEVVGVVGDTLFRGPRSEPRPEIYIPHEQNAYLAVNVAVRTAGEPGALAASVRRAAAEVDPEQAVHSVVTMEQLERRSTARERLAALLLGALAGIAASLAALGVYGLQAYLVGRRRAEVGVRMALGARRRDVARLVVGDAVATTLPGAAAGLVGVLVLAPAVRGLLFGVAPADPVSLCAAALAIPALAAAAAILPARRAAGVDPTEALRRD